MENRAKRGVLNHKEQLGPFPLARIKHVDKPSTVITDAVQRIDLRDNAYGLAARGEYGPAVQRGVQKSLPGKYPLSAVQKDVIDHIALTNSNSVAPEIAPIPQDPQVLTRHIKAVGYFLKADIMGACQVPKAERDEKEHYARFVCCRHRWNSAFSLWQWCYRSTSYQSTNC